MAMEDQYVTSVAHLGICPSVLILWHTAATAACHRVHNRAGSALIERARAEFAHPAALGKVYPVAVPPESALRVEEGIKEVLYVVGPNMNPLRANCLETMDDAISKLKTAYASIFHYALSPRT
ncbi:hypothetical protein HDU86_000185 [Geranomyces michiganensis]|nr:hypothetical protein HDU86_000185 [Geranomyces michiganensis]